MRVDLITLFPDTLEALANYGQVRRACEIGSLTLTTANPRDYSEDRHRTVDARPYGGGAGMLMRPGPLAACIDAVKQHNPGPVIYMSAQGQPLKQATLQRLAGEPGLIVLAGHYEGVDARLIESRVDEEISLGDYILSGGDLAALVLVEGVARLLPGALGNPASAGEDSFSDGLLEYPQYTRPREFENRPVPEVLLSGDHHRIRQWRMRQSLLRTRERRPELLRTALLDAEQRVCLQRLSDPTAE